MPTGSSLPTPPPPRRSDEDRFAASGVPRRRRGHEDPREVLFRPEIPGDPWDDHTELLTEDGNLELSVGGYLIRTGDRNILVDAGVGTIDNGKYRGGQFLESLKSHGLDPADITDVVFTHLHFDHVGWATKKGAVVFENATYRVHKLDWEHFVESPGAEPGAVRKLKPLESGSNSSPVTRPSLPDWMPGTPPATPRDRPPSSSPARGSAPR